MTDTITVYKKTRDINFCGCDSTVDFSFRLDDEQFEEVVNLFRKLAEGYEEDEEGFYIYDETSSEVGRIKVDNAIIIFYAMFDQKYQASIIFRNRNIIFSYNTNFHKSDFEQFIEWYEKQ